jgi:hypothetical protein
MQKSKKQQIIATPTPPYPEYSDDLLNAPANYGILEPLLGTWVNVKTNNNKTDLGLLTICMPSPGTNSETIFGIYHFLCDDYVEELSFTPVSGGIRNRGGTNEQFVGALKYNQSIKRASDGVGIHAEDGMYLWLNQMYNHQATEQSVIEDNGYPGISTGLGSNGPNFVPPYSIARSGTIPHGSTIMLTGDFDPDVNGAPQFPTGTDCWTAPFVSSWPKRQIANAPNLAASPLAISPSMGASALLIPPGDSGQGQPLNLDKPAPAWAFDKSLPVTDPDGNLTYFQRIVAHPNYPYSVRPDLRLRDAIKNQNISKHTLIQLTTKHDGGPQGGILNTPFVQKFANVTEMTLNMWLETVVENGTEVLQLQYEQIMFLEFMVGSNGQTTRWPHIQINTLRKKK